MLQIESLHTKSNHQNDSNRDLNRIVFWICPSLVFTYCVYVSDTVLIRSCWQYLFSTIRLKFSSLTLARYELSAAWQWYIELYLHMCFYCYLILNSCLQSVCSRHLRYHIIVVAAAAAPYITTTTTTTTTAYCYCCCYCCYCYYYYYYCSGQFILWSSHLSLLVLVLLFSLLLNC